MGETENTYISTTALGLYVVNVWLVTQARHAATQLTSLMLFHRTSRQMLGWYLRQKVSNHKCGLTAVR